MNQLAGALLLLAIVFALIWISEGGIRRWRQSRRHRIVLEVLAELDRVKDGASSLPTQRSRSEGDTN